MGLFRKKPTTAGKLSGDSSISQWLDHPIGGAIFKEVLEQSGNDVSVLNPVKRMPLKRLIAMSGGQFSQEIIDEMIRKVEAGSVATAEPAAEKPVEAPAPKPVDKQTAPAPAAKPTPKPVEKPAPQPSTESNQTIPELDFEPLVWQERIIPHRFRGKTIIVTGAGSGIGFAVASRIAREGGRVIAVDVNKDRLFEFKHSVPRADVEAVVADITNDKDIQKVIRKAGRTIDGLANVAGIMDNFTPIHEMSDEVWNRVLNVNVNGMMRLSRAVLPNMLSHHSGNIVNIGSEASLRGSAAGAAYTTSKHAVVGLTKSMAFMYGASGIRINMVAPGPVATNIQAKFESKLGQIRTRDVLSNISAPVEPEQLAASITFLLSDDSVNINGAILPSDGGWSVQ